jgi:hypothetical protein
MLNREKTKAAIKRRPLVGKDLPGLRAGEPGVLSGRDPMKTKDIEGGLRPGDNPKRQVLFNALKQK